ncbi:MAG: type II toxin-antitoxin system RelE/ParE family toxin [Candidatus Levybacteria bacterium]|nr:type II toxin-antitoxin system RelE/ParE family toxin [Candidatus Levybacteria bacterium]
MFQLKLSNHAKKDLKKLDKKFIFKVSASLELLKTNPFLGQKMTGDFQGSYRIKIPPIRIVYEVDFANKIILIRAVWDRQGVYRG